MTKVFLGSGRSNVNEWKQHPVVPNAVYQWIQTGLPNYAEIPEYVTTLTGDSSIWPVLGASSVYSPTSKRFLVILALEQRYANIVLTPKIVRAWNWTINWAAFGDPTIDESRQEDGDENRTLPDELGYIIS